MKEDFSMLSRHTKRRNNPKVLGVKPTFRGIADYGVQLRFQSRENDAHIFIANVPYEDLFKMLGCINLGHLHSRLSAEDNMELYRLAKKALKEPEETNQTKTA